MTGPGGGDRVVVSGLGCICAAGGSMPEVMDSLYRGRSSPAPPRGIEADLDTAYPVFEAPSTLRGGEESTADRPMTRTGLLAAAAVEEALAMADLTPETLRTRRVGVALGTTIGCYLLDEEFYREYRRGNDPPFDSARKFFDNNPALRAAGDLGVTGPAVTVTNACSSGIDAVALGRSWIRSGRCDIVIAGGADELGRSTYLGFVSLMVASTDPCRPFDRRRNGLNAGEGAGVLILESRSSLEGRAGPALASLAGYGCSADAYHPISMDPEGRGLRRAIHAAMAEADVSPDQVGFVNAHGTATEINDQIEGTVLADIFPSSLSVVATKGYTGHTMGASGGIASALTVQALLDGRLPATAGFAVPDPECRVVPTSGNVDLEAEYGMVNSLAFGGVNSVLIFKRGG